MDRQIGGSGSLGRYPALITGSADSPGVRVGGRTQSICSGAGTDGHAGDRATGNFGFGTA